MGGKSKEGGLSVVSTACHVLEPSAPFQKWENGRENAVLMMEVFEGANEVRGSVSALCAASEKAISSRARGAG